MGRESYANRPDMSSKTAKTKDTPEHRWLSYRPEIKVLDCTIRDGGLMNNHHFDDKIVKMVYDTCVAAGIDYMEMGYKASRKGIKQGEHGCWKYCTEDDMRRIVGENETDLKLTIMADAERCDYHHDILPKKDSVMDVIRVATYINQIPTALDMVKDAHDKGYETTVNLMAASIIPERELDEGLEMLAKSEAKAIYLVDSFGAFYSEQMRYMVKKYLVALQTGRQGSGRAYAQQSATGLRQHHRRHHRGRQFPRRHHGRLGPRRGQLPDGIAHRFSA